MGVARDRCMETSTSTGTGNFTLAGAVLGYRALSPAVDLQTRFGYAIEAIDGTGALTGEWEVGEGLLSAATTLVRDIPAINSAGTAVALNFSAGTKRVFITLDASEWQDKGQQVARFMQLAMN